MALSKNKTGIMAAISAAAEASQSGEAARAERSLPKGTIGSVRAGLGGIQEIDTAQIIPWGPQDRLELTAVNSDADGLGDLVDSIRTSGQQVPVLLRPAADRDGFFEVIYGRRRILACQQLDLPVRALIRTLDDTEALMAKGLENASRTNLSFYERARFADAILAQGYSRKEVMEALAISKNTLSQMERITRIVPAELGDMIGAAPGAGRPKWNTLATAFETGKLTLVEAKYGLLQHASEAASDDKLTTLIAFAHRKKDAPKQPPPRTPVPGVKIKSQATGVAVTVGKTGKSKAFGDWFEANAEDIMRSAFDRFERQNRSG